MLNVNQNVKLSRPVNEEREKRGSEETEKRATLVKIENPGCLRDQRAHLQCLSNYYSYSLSSDKTLSELLCNCRCCESYTLEMLDFATFCVVIASCIYSHHNSQDIISQCSTSMVVENSLSNCLDMPCSSGASRGRFAPSKLVDRRKVSSLVAARCIGQL